ncbi:MAG TPA: carbohydrate-binding protein [Vicinamibacterales bacterium]|nr:carbohydrate-binding protein [Vicinamibacterales bacterium]
MPQAVAQTKALPGTIQAEDFDSGANGSAYRDTTSGNTGGKYRSTDVDIESCSEGGYDVGWTTPGEWLNYTVNVASAGTYNLDLRVASANGGSFYVHFNGVNETGTIYVPNTGGWQAWRTIRTSVTLAAGTQSMRLTIDSGSLNVNSIEVSSTSTSTTTSSASSGTSSPFGGVAHAIPGWVQAEDFDNGGQSVAYYDLSAGNAGGTYRSTDVDIQRTSSGGYAVGWIGAGEWLKYTVNVASSGTYTAVARVASAGSGGTFHIEFNGTDKTGPMRVPNTGGWQTYQDLTAQVSLSAGVQSMRVVFDSNGATGAIGNLSAVRFDTGSASAPPPPTSTSGGGKLRMMTWNINFGGTDVGGTPAAQAQLIASQGADVVSLQEASTFGENMPVTYPERLRQLTGQTWYAVWAPHNPTQTASEGVLIVSRYPIVASSKMNAEGRGFARALIDVGGVRVNVFAVHLEYYDTAKRTRQLSAFMSWARQFSGPRIAAGDFNSWWGESWIQTMEKEYSDTWEMVSGTVQNGYTKGNVRFDYIFRSFTDETRLTPTACWVKSTSQSDHYPVLADFTVR